MSPNPDLQHKINRARALGKAAQARGGPLAPAKDEQLLNLLETLTGKGGVEIIHAYANGYLGVPQVA